MAIKSASATALVTGVFLVGFAASGAQAAPVQPDREPTKLAEASQARPAAELDEGNAATCNTSRKRLWVESEGWIVRRVTICR